jgi:hypothetical protein
MFLNTFYIQKSRIMLLPLLGLDPKDLKPATTYIAYKNIISLQDYKLICGYKRDDDQYYDYRNNVLFKHPNYETLYRGLYTDYLVFDLSEYKKDFDVFLTGKYSKLSKRAKTAIKEYYNKTRVAPILLDTHLNPEEYHEVYANEFKVDVETVKEAYETLSPPDLIKEHLE